MNPKGATTGAASWCVVDECPASICCGPHVSHECERTDGSIIGKPDQPCPFCGELIGGHGPGAGTNGATDEH